MGEQMEAVASRYVPALGLRALTGLYDPVLRWTLREESFKAALAAQAAIAPEMRVLDLGAGTGTLTLMLQRSAPNVEVVGLDGDPEVLGAARAKAAAAHAAIRFDHGMAFALPYDDGTFDRVVSSLLLHHLSPGDKRRTLREVYRVLARGGELHVADWGRPQNALMRLLFYGVQLLDGFASTDENVAGMLPDLFHEAGFVHVRETHAFATMFGTLALYRATRP